MEQIKKIIDFLGNLYPYTPNSGFQNKAFKNSNYTIPKEITRWWEMGLNDFVTYIHKANGGEGMFAYVKSCQYTDFAIEELKMYKFNIENQELKQSVQELDDSNQELKHSVRELKMYKFNTENQELIHFVEELKTENQELKSLIYSMLDEICELKELKHYVQELNDSNQELKHSVRELKMYKFKTENRFYELKERVKFLEDHQLNSID